ncbi:thiamine diphosphokinase [Parablautia intestinalis]|jgi:thiamine pyrophosphokinase|uniref:Thiamine diphosphokinase n=1 Tax=Parablautia intestinalis TaxID=2320100 RepID=A0A3A9AQ75_9FIRM|nr:thiamine diphosphokinase [Parablautia intestinalis]MCI8615625.1 thiamine diphosphokinase [Lachnospiraceae bacterium]MDE7048124.1 thiamine diphosphokinase [Lachnospiraceae bacterium]RKI93518.1 thiamine diphosphokinase [Parablautia intestinalis]
MGICYIVGAGEFGDGLPLPGKEDMLIACDGGYAHCRERGIRMDLVVGDFDSLKEVPQHPGVIVLKPEKDETDTGWAVMEGFQRGYREFVIYGGTGGRISHTIANIQILADLAAKGASGILIGSHSWYRVIRDGEIHFGACEKGFLSVFCLGDSASGVFEEGLKYDLKDAVLRKEYPVGVSNEFIGKDSRISVKKGMLLLIQEDKYPEE